MYFAGHGCREAGAFDVYAPPEPRLFHYAQRKEFMNEEDAKDSFRKPAGSCVIIVERIVCALLRKKPWIAVRHAYMNIRLQRT